MYQTLTEDKLVIKKRKTPARVIKTLTDIRDSGLTNMFDRRRVIDLSFELDYWAGYWLSLQWRNYGQMLVEFSENMDMK